MPGAKSRLSRVAHTFAPCCEGAMVLEPGDLLIYRLSLLFSTVHISTSSTFPPWLIPTKEVGMFQIGANEIPDKKDWSRPLVLHLGQFCIPEDPWTCVVVTTQWYWHRPAWDQGRSSMPYCTQDDSVVHRMRMSVVQRMRKWGRYGPIAQAG